MKVVADQVEEVKTMADLARVAEMIVPDQQEVSVDLEVLAVVLERIAADQEV